MRTIGRPGKNKCTLSSHTATRELYAKVPSRRAPVGALCEGSMRIELRSELYAKGALCSSTPPSTIQNEKYALSYFQAEGMKHDQELYAKVSNIPSA